MPGSVLLKPSFTTESIALRTLGDIAPEYRLPPLANFLAGGLRQDACSLKAYPMFLYRRGSLIALMITAQPMPHESR